MEKRFFYLIHNLEAIRCDKCDYTRDNDMRCMCEKSPFAGSLVTSDNYCHRFILRNDPLSIEELKSMKAPVWCQCKTIEGANGYWCLCDNGVIICPSGQSFDVEEIPTWVFLRYPREDI